MLKHIPNILTLARFVLIPVIVSFLMTEDYLMAFAFLTLSGLTDILDGFIARKFNFITNFGKLIDPLADKATQMSVLTALMIQQVIPMWILIIVLLKEFIMICGASFLYGKDLVVSSKWYGKLSTVLFYVAIVASLFIRQFNSYAIYQSKLNYSPIPAYDQYLYYLALATTLFSLIMYFKSFYQNGYLKKENLKLQSNSTKEKN